MSEQIALSPSEISDIIKQKIEQFKVVAEVSNEGTIVSLKDGIVRLHGMEAVMQGEMIEFPGNTFGLALNLERDSVGAVILGDASHLSEGQKARCTGRILEVPVGPQLLGRVVNALGEPIDGKGPIETKLHAPIEKVAPGVIARQSVSQPVQTGLKAVDAMIPVGRGQRELIIGDRQTGKTAIAIDTIINQKGQGVKCFYVAIGQKQSTVALVVEKLRQAGAMDYTTIIAANASDPAPMQFLAAYSGTAMAEHFRDNGGHALIIYDDLTKQAQAYRQMSLLLRRPPGREAYPGDVFYLHSRLLERAAKLSDDKGAGSLTALPVIETQAGDISAYIPTNVISITDGQIFLESDLFYKGVRPAISIGKSVSRVGGSAQIKAMKQVAGSIKLELAQFRALEAFAAFASDLDKASQQQLSRGRRLVEVLKQGQYQPVKVEEQIVMIFAATNGYTDAIPETDVNRYEVEMIQFLKQKYSSVLATIADKKQISDDAKKELVNALGEFKAIFQASK